jgi:hypothetical protein
MCLYVFNGIQASFAGLFDAKKKEPFGGGEPKQVKAKEKNLLIVILNEVKNPSIKRSFVPQDDNL